ncbi:ABC transporter transmembrane domain-containing protein [Corynebacterium striatum]|uniref:ABC transporter transmembrane domain-containing protein n=1 Tax=Corynebacterium striatum TaxID=43770 RepID=UPI003ABF4923
MSNLPAPKDPRWLLKTVFSRREKTIPAAILMSISFVCNGMTPVIVGRAIDGAIAIHSFDALLRWLGILVAIFALNAVAAWFARGMFSRAMLEVGHDLRMAVTDRIQDPRGIGGRARTAGELLSIASSDAKRVSEAVIMTVFPVAEVCSIVYVAIMTSRVNVPLGIAVLLGGPVVVWISLVAAKPLRSRSGARQAALAQASATATDVVQGLRILKGLGAIGTVRKRYSAVSDAAYERTIDANGAQARLNAITEAVGSIYVIAMAIAAGALAVNGTVTVGELITVVGLTQFVITPMTMMGKNIASRWAAAQASGRRITELLDSPFRAASTPQAPQWGPGLHVVKGAAPEELDDLPRERFLVAPHAADLFAGSVQSNIHEDSAVAAQALQVAAAEDIPGGLNKDVGENGGALSGGQRQRVALARAIAAAPEVLILQDPTTAVDSVTEQKIAERVSQARAGQTTVVYTNAPAWAAVAETVEAPQLNEHTGKGR